MDDIFREIRNNSIREAYFDALKSLRKSMPYISTEEIIQEVEEELQQKDNQKKDQEETEK